MTSESRVTLKTIATKTGYSITTVSRALAGYDDVSESTRKMIQEVARSLGYYPNLTARHLQSQRNYTVGIVVPQASAYFADVYLMQMLSSIGDMLADEGYDLLMSLIPPGEDEHTAYRRMVEGRRVDGLILLQSRRFDDRIRYLAETSMPFVVLGRTEWDLEYPYVDIDEFSGSYQLTRHLLGLGHRRIAYIAAALDLTTGYQRYQGYQQALQDAGIPLDDGMLILEDATAAGGARAAKQLLGHRLPPTAIMVARDQMALGVYRIMGEERIMPGAELSVAGFDDIPVADLLSLTTVKQPKETGIYLTRLLLKLLAEEADGGSQITLDTELVVRESTRVPYTP